MPRHDPIPPHDQRRQQAWRRYRQLMTWMATAAVVAVLLALIYLKSSGERVPLAVIIATIVGVGMSVLLGTALMGLVFLSNLAGHDEEAGGKDENHG
jgi:multisubunit Na+/H+ antiporter MnhB subunit